MLDLIILLRDVSQKNELMNLFGADLVIPDDKGCERYSKLLPEIPEGRVYFDFDTAEGMKVYYSAEELGQVPYDVAGMCNIVFYPPDVIFGVTEKIARYDRELFVDDDHGKIESIIRYRERLMKKEVYPFNAK